MKCLPLIPLIQSIYPDLYRVDNLELANTQVSQFTTVYNLQFTMKEFTVINRFGVGESTLFSTFFYVCTELKTLK